jgi:hypothetical protein
MGMFDSFYDAKGQEWQTKAYNRQLEAFELGDTVPLVPPYDLMGYQVEVLGGPYESPYEDAYATIRDGRVAQVPAERDGTLPLLNYGGHLIEPTKEA